MQFTFFHLIYFLLSSYFNESLPNFNMVSEPWCSFFLQEEDLRNIHTFHESMSYYCQFCSLFLSFCHIFGIIYSSVVRTEVLAHFWCVDQKLHIFGKKQLNSMILFVMPCSKRCFQFHKVVILLHLGTKLES